MKVKDLVADLGKLDQNLDILCYTEDEEFLPAGHGFRILEIDTVSESEGERHRGDDEIATLKIGKTQYSQKFAIIAVNSA